MGVSPHGGSWLLPGLPAGPSLLMLVPLPETPVLLKPYSCGRIQVRGGDRSWEAGFGMSELTTWWTSFRLSCMFPPPGSAAVNAGHLGRLKEHHPSILSHQSARVAEGQGFSALSTSEPAQPGFPAAAGRGHQRGQRILFVKPAAVNTQASFLGLLRTGAPAAHPVQLWKEKAHEIICANVSGVQCSEVKGTPKCLLQGSSLEMSPIPDLLHLGLPVCKMPWCDSHAQHSWTLDALGHRLGLNPIPAY